VQREQLVSAALALDRAARCARSASSIGAAPGQHTYWHARVHEPALITEWQPPAGTIGERGNPATLGDRASGHDMVSPRPDFAATWRWRCPGTSPKEALGISQKRPLREVVFSSSLTPRGTCPQHAWVLSPTPNRRSGTTPRAVRNGTGQTRAQRRPYLPPAPGFCAARTRCHRFPRPFRKGDQRWVRPIITSPAERWVRSELAATLQGISIAPCRDARASPQRSAR
jgi:hypothetical protein